MTKNFLFISLLFTLSLPLYSSLVLIKPGDVEIELADGQMGIDPDQLASVIEQSKTLYDNLMEAYGTADIETIKVQKTISLPHINKKTFERIIAGIELLRKNRIAEFEKYVSKLSFEEINDLYNSSAFLDISLITNKVSEILANNNNFFKKILDEFKTDPQALKNMKLSNDLIAHLQKTLRTRNQFLKIEKNIYRNAGPVIQAIPVKLPADILSSCVSIHKNSQLVAYGNTQGSVKIFSVSLDQSPVETQFFKEREFTKNKSITALAFHPQQKIIVVGTEDKLLKIWDLETDTVTDLFVQPNNNANPYIIRALTFSSNGQVLGVAQIDRNVVLFDFPSKARIAAVDAMTSDVKSISFSPRGKYFATGCAENNESIHIWQSPSYSLYSKINYSPRSTNTLVNFINEDLLAIGSQDGARIWNIRENKLDISLPKPPNMSHIVKSILASMYAPLLFILYGTKDIHVFDISKQHYITNLKVSFLQNLALNDQLLGAVGSQEENEHLWNISTLSKLSRKLSLLTTQQILTLLLVDKNGLSILSKNPHLDAYYKDLSRGIEPILAKTFK